jgi:hypothetical protein
MYNGVLHHVSNGRLTKPLVVRAGLPRTFGSLIFFLAGMFLCLGIYILEDLFAHPVDAAAAALIAAAFVIALAILLLFYLFKPSKNSGKAGYHSPRSRSNSLAKQPLLKGASRRDRGDELRKNLVYQRVYVDPSRIRPWIRIRNQARGMAGK